MIVWFHGKLRNITVIIIHLTKTPRISCIIHKARKPRETPLRPNRQKYPSGDRPSIRRNWKLVTTVFPPISHDPGGTWCCVENLSEISESQKTKLAHRKPLRRGLRLFRNVELVKPRETWIPRTTHTRIAVFYKAFWQQQNSVSAKPAR